MTRKNRLSSGPGYIHFQGGWRKWTHEEDRLENVEEVGGESGVNDVSEVKGVERFMKKEVVTSVKRSKKVKNTMSELCPLDHVPCKSLSASERIISVEGLGQRQLQKFRAFRERKKRDRMVDDGGSGVQVQVTGAGGVNVP